MTTEEIRRKAELRVGTIGVNEETQKALVNWIVLTVREATAQNTSDTLEQFRKVVSNESYEWDGGKEEWELYTKSLTPTPLESDKTKTI